MPKTVAALYDSRDEAQLARGRLISEARAKSPRILAKDTAAAIDGLKIAPRDAHTYREALQRGAHLLVAEVPSDAPAKRIIELLEQSTGTATGQENENAWGNGEQGVRVELPEERNDKPHTQAAFRPRASPAQQDEKVTAAAPQPAEPLLSTDASALPAPIEEARVPVVEEELRIGKREVVGGGARVRSVTRETPAEEQIALREESIEVEGRQCERQLTDEDVEQAGLFKERVFEVTAMREEPVVTKTAVVREEVILRRRVRERTETIRDTVRHTEVEVEEFSGAARDGPRFFTRENDRS